MENAVYTLVQIAHNLGAAAVVGGPAAGWWLERKSLSARRLAFIALIGWIIQAASGAGFALTSYSLKGAVPEVTGIALAALVIKISATFVGLLTATLILWKGPLWRMQIRIKAWQTMFFVALSALIGAAFLRWYL